MSVLSDKTIRALSTLPPHLATYEAWVESMANGEPHLHDTYQAERAEAESKLLIQPFEPSSVSSVKYRDIGDEEHEYSNRKILSYGTSSYGYDAKLAHDIQTFTSINGGEIDPKRFDTKLCVKPKVYTDSEGAAYVIVPAHGFVLGRTVETFCIPRDVIVICLGKSTYARTGLIVNVTPLEPEWRGQVTLELSNTTSLPMRVYLNEGICQFLFLRGEGDCDVSYADKKGKYQDQKGTTFCKV